MRTTDNRVLLGLLIVAGCVAGGYSAYAAYSNGATIATGVAGTVFGLAFAAVVIASWIMLPWADKRADEGAVRDAWMWRMAWLMALGFVLANSVAYSAHYKIEAAEANGIGIASYERANRAQSLALAQLQMLRTNPRYAATNGCSNVTVPQSRIFCNELRAVEAQIRDAEAVLKAGKPASKDAGAEILAWVLGVDENKVGRGLPVFWAIVLELVASLCMKDAFASIRHSKKLKFKTRTDPERNMGASSDSTTLDTPSGNGLLPAPVAIFSFQSMSHALVRPAATNDNWPTAAYA